MTPKTPKSRKHSIRVRVCNTHATAGINLKKNMREKFIEQKLGVEVKRLGGLSIKLLSSLFVGLPDRLVVIPQGRIYFIELKAPNGKQSPIQKVVMKKLADLGCNTGVISTIEELESFIEKVRREIG